MDCSEHMSDWRSRARVEARRFEEETWLRSGSEPSPPGPLWPAVSGPSPSGPDSSPIRVGLLGLRGLADDAAYPWPRVCATSSLGTPDWLSWARGVRRAAGRPCWWGRWFLSQMR